MKYLSYYVILLSVLIAGFGCTDDEVNPVPTPGNKSANEWIYEEMVDHYLWYKEIPSKNELDFSENSQQFFYSLLSEKDGKTSYYSYIEAKTDTKSYMGDTDGFGFEYQAYRLNKYTDQVALQVLYVLPDSPAGTTTNASGDKLKRGDWIISINGSSINTNNYYYTINSSATLTLGVAKEANATTSTPLKLYAGTVYDSPVHISKTINYKGKKVGYLLYNHFTTGPGGTSDSTFDDELENALQSMSNIDDMILDLRYNGGGYVSCAQLLASYLVPVSNINDVFCKMTYNEKQSKSDYNYSFLSSVAGNNLNLKRLFVITSYRTASASELVIASLLPYLKEENIYIINTSLSAYDLNEGEKATTEGKNVGSREFKEDTYDWILHPIVCHVTNKDELDYSKGFEATTGFILNEDAAHELGDENENILKSVLEFITTGTHPTTYSSTRTVSSNLIPVKSSLDYKSKSLLIE